MINETIVKFMEHWDNADKNRDGAIQGDQIRVLAVAFRLLDSHLKATRAKTFGYLVPKNNGHAWVPGFLEDEQPEIAELGRQLSTIQDQYAVLQSDIVLAVELCEGFSMKRLEREVHREKQNFGSSNQLARMQLAREARKPNNIGKSMAEIAALPSVAKIENAASLAKEQDAGVALYYADNYRRVSEIIRKWQPSLEPASHRIKNPSEANSEPNKPVLIPFGNLQGSAFGAEAMQHKLPKV